MQDRLFVSMEHPRALPETDLIKGAIVGAGAVGMAIAYSMLIQNTFDELVLVDIDRRKVEGEVMDLVHGIPFVEPSVVRAGTLADCGGVDVVVITAGARQREGESRLSLVQRNVEIFRGLIGEIMEHCPNAILLVVSNPVDVMTYVAMKLAGLPPSRVIGSGTVLDTARFRYLLAERLRVDPRSLHAYIIGEHGDSEVPVWSRANVAGAFLSEIEPAVGTPDDPAKMFEVFEHVKNAAYEIIERKGATSWAIGLATTQIARAITRNQNRVLPVSVLMSGLHGIEEVCLAYPAVLNRQGIDRLVKFSLSPAEEEQLQRSARVMRQTLDEIQF
nr:L-lactate dehydrogenase [Gloeobacter morelensis]